jgi:NADPH-dependent ferric siderophore reductase
MLTLPERAGVAHDVQDDRPGYRPYRARVREVERLTPHFVRVTFAGEDLGYMATADVDQRIKIVFPFLDGRLCDALCDGPAASWLDGWRALPEEDRNPFRTYTVNAVRPEDGEVDVVFVDHVQAVPGGGDGSSGLSAPGPASRWLRGAYPGDSVLIVGPDSRSRHCRIGIDWHPGSAAQVLLAGDETAVPAICSILQSLPSSVRATALAEVPTSADVLPVSVGDNVDLRWLPRAGAPHGAPLTAAVCSWLDAHPDLVQRAGTPRPQPLPDTDVDREVLWDSPENAWGRVLYAWLAGEAALIKSLRRCLVSERGIDRRRVAFMGYWRAGLPERNG